MRCFRISRSADNVAFGLKQEKLPRKERQTRVNDMLGMVKMEDFSKRKPHQLSGGQRQRVALARALVKRPKVFLLDEPLAALDKKLRTQTQSELRDLQKKLGITFIIVTHDQEEAMTMADRIAVMNNGKLAQVASPREIYEHPASRWVAEFIGDVNLLEGTVSTVDAHETLVETARRNRARRAGQCRASWRPRDWSRSARKRSRSRSRMRAIRRRRTIPPAAF